MPETIYCECPKCGTVQQPNVTVGDLDTCDNCSTEYMMYANEVDAPETEGSA